MARAYEVFRLCSGTRRNLDGPGPVCRRNAGGNPGSCLDADRETGFIGRFVLLHHHGQVQFLHLGPVQRQADKPPAEPGHEVYRLRGDRLGGHAQVALIFPVLVIHENDHLPGPDIPDYLFNSCNCHAVLSLQIRRNMFPACCLLDKAMPG